MKLPLRISALIASLTLASGCALADDNKPTQTQDQTRAQTKDQAQQRDQERVYGSQLMTRKERAEFHARMRAAKTEEEREKIRKEHHEQMKERARARGVTLPDEPPAAGGAMMGPGSGMGMGGGMGPRGR